MTVPAMILLAIAADQPVFANGRMLLIDQLSIWIAAVGVVVPLLFSVLVYKLAHHNGLDDRATREQMREFVSNLKLKHAQRSIAQSNTHK